MQKILYYSAGTVGTIALCAFLWWAFSPLLFDTVVDEALPTTTTAVSATVQTNTAVPTDMQTTPEGKRIAPEQPVSPTLIKTGQFTGYDALHSGSGTANIYKDGDTYFVRLESDFAVTNGPDLYVSLGKNGEYATDGVLALLKGNKGAQNYAIPSSLNFADYDSIYIWCKAFSVPFAKAVLN